MNLATLCRFQVKLLDSVDFETFQSLNKRLIHICSNIWPCNCILFYFLGEEYWLCLDFRNRNMFLSIRN